MNARKRALETGLLQKVPLATARGSDSSAKCPAGKFPFKSEKGQLPRVCFYSDIFKFLFNSQGDTI